MPKRKTYSYGEFEARQHDNGYYYVHWYVQDGRKSRRKSLRTRCFETAKQRLKNFYERNLQLKHEPAASVTVCQLIARYAKQHLSKTNSPDTAKSHLKCAVRLMTDMPVSDFGIASQDKLIGRMKDEGWSDTTVQKRMAYIRAALKWAYKFELVDNIPQFLGVKAENQRYRYLSMEELQRLWRVDMPDHLREWLVFAIATMARKRIILQAKSDQLDLERGLIDMQPKDKPKTSKRNPVLPIIPSLMPYLIHKDGYLITLNGKPIKDIKKSFAAAVKRAGLKNIVPKDIRTSISTLLRGRNVNAAHIEGSLGHVF